MRKVLLPVLLLLGACTDVIDIEPDNAPTLLVVDAWLTDVSAEQTISLSTSTGYFQQANPAVTDARVEITDSNGKLFEFVDQGDGRYVWTPAFFGDKLGQVGTGYLLSIDWNGRLVQSATAMLPTATIDEIRQEFRENELGFEDGIWCEFIGRDLPGQGNTYWIKAYKNGNYLNRPEEINLAFDGSFDAGTEFDGLVFIPPIRELINPFPDDLDGGLNNPAPYQPGDVVRVEIHSISLAAFAFMEIARDQILNGNNGIFATPLANSDGNVVSDGQEQVLGVFNVASVSALERTIQ